MSDRYRAKYVEEYDLGWYVVDTQEHDRPIWPCPTESSTQYGARRMNLHQDMIDLKEKNA